jgi:ABC-type antimicrobial peptide transport system permease subunit
MGERPNGLYARTEGDPRALAAALAPVLRSFSPRVRYADVQPLRERLAPETRAWTLGATLFTAFGLLALLVAAIGLYSVLSFDVAQRTKEIGIRTALGAQRSRVLRDVLTAGLRLAVLGVILGLGAALAAGRYVQDLLFRVHGADPLVLTLVGGVLVLVAVIASAVPGARAARVDPMDALRAE